MEHIEQVALDYPVDITVVNHGKVFSKKDWFTFYCGNCGRQVHCDAKECKQCGAILQRKGGT